MGYRHTNSLNNYYKVDGTRFCSKCLNYYCICGTYGFTRFSSTEFEDDLNQSHSGLYDAENCRRKYGYSQDLQKSVISSPTRYLTSPFIYPDSSYISPVESSCSSPLSFRYDKLYSRDSSPCLFSSPTKFKSSYLSLSPPTSPLASSSHYLSPSPSKYLSSLSLEDIHSKSPIFNYHSVTPSYYDRVSSPIYSPKKYLEFGSPVLDYKLERYPYYPLPDYCFDDDFSPIDECRSLSPIYYPSSSHRFVSERSVDNIPYDCCSFSKI